MTSVENVTGPIAYHAEGPVWSPTWGGLRYVDMLAGDLMTLTDQGVARRNVGKIAAFVRPRTRGGFVVGLERQLGITDSDDGELALLPPMWEDTQVRFNDGGCSPDGTLYCGSMHYDQVEGAAKLYRVGEDRSIDVVEEAATVSNGIAFSPDGSLCYYNDTHTGRTDVYDNDGDRLVNRRPFVTYDDQNPDGLTVDSEGGVWVALFGSGQVQRHAPDGTLSEVIEVPPTQTTACTFGGDDLRTLFITTSREDLPDDAEPEAGSVYAARVGVAGLPVAPWAG